MSEPETCRVLVVDSSGQLFHACGRPVKRDGKCGPHARAAKKHEAKLLRTNQQERRVG